MVEIQLKETYGNWRDVADAANTTVNREEGTKEPNSSWKKKILLAEHSPIRLIFIRWKWINLPSWISVHFVRHKYGIEHWVRSQRQDRTGVDRSSLPQDTLIEHECCADQQSIIYISRKRLCNKASPETKQVWSMFLEAIKEKNPELYDVCVPECIYRGFCPELKSCGYIKSEQALKKLEDYRRN